VAELLQALVDKHPTGTIYVTWDNADTHEDDEVEAVVRGAAGRLVLLYLPTYSPWLNPIEPKWIHTQRKIVEPARLLTAREVEDRVCETLHCSHEDRLAISEKVT